VLADADVLPTEGDVDGALDALAAKAREGVAVA
jgi:hypothetical protein